MKVKPHLPLSELKRLERCEKDADRARRLRIVILGLEGWTAPAVAMAVGLSRRICQRWVRRYNDLGTEGLDDLPRPAVTLSALCRPRRGGPPTDRLRRNRRGRSLLAARQRHPAYPGRGVRPDAQLGGRLSPATPVWDTPICAHVRDIARRTRRRSRLLSLSGPRSSRRSPPNIRTSNCGFTFRTNRVLDNKGQRQMFGQKKGRGPRRFGKRSTNTCGCWAWCVLKRGTPKGC